MRPATNPVSRIATSLVIALCLGLSFVLSGVLLACSPAEQPATEEAPADDGTITSEGFEDGDSTNLVPGEVPEEGDDEDGADPY